MNTGIFNSVKIGNVVVKNRLVRSATFEGAADENGFPTPRYLNMYRTLAKNNIGLIITGFAFVSSAGHAMQKTQAGIDTDDKVNFYKIVTNEVHKYDCPIIMQIAHAGRQTLKNVIGKAPISSTGKKSIYFREKPKIATEEEIKDIIYNFIISAQLAKEAGFDGVQIHAAHGYLLHQFLLPDTNKLKNPYGINKQTGLGTKLLEDIFDGIKEKCGNSFLVLIKISGGHDLSTSFFPDKFDQLILFLNKKQFDAIEISYGTMDYPLNIFRGDINPDTIFKYNPIFMTNSRLRKYISSLFINCILGPKLKDFKPAYNLHFAERAKQLTEIPIISVGGFRNKNEIENAINNNQADLVGLSRPFICEPDFAKKLQQSSDNYISRCKNCNECVFMCDSGRPTTCYSKTNN